MCWKTSLPQRVSGLSGFFDLKTMNVGAIKVILRYWALLTFLLAIRNLQMFVSPGKAMQYCLLYNLGVNASVRSIR